MKKKSRTKELAVGIDLGGTNVRAGLVDGSSILKVQARRIRSQGTEVEVFEDLCSVIEAVIDERVQGIGIGVPSLVDPRNGTIFDTTNIPSWKHVPLKKKLEKKYRLAVRIDNDANCFALGEKHFGAGRKCDNFVGLVIGTGLGAGIISNGKLHSGTDCGAGEFGLISYRDSIVEHYASGQFFKKKNWEGGRLFDGAKAGDSEALAVFKEYGQHLGFAIKLILYSLAPEMIVLGGSVSHSYPFFSESLQASLQDFAYPSILRKLRLKTSRVKDVAVLGAATLIENQMV